MNSIENIEFNCSASAEAYYMLIEALSAPEVILLKNSGIYSLDKLKNDRNFEEGYDCRTKVWCNLKEHGIIDPTLVIKAAIENSVSIASTILTTQATIISEDKE